MKKEMSSNHSRVRLRGQRLIPLTFIHRSSLNDDQSNDRRNKRPKISLADFLDRKLQKTSDPSKLVKDKDRPFLSPGNDNQKTKGPELNDVLDVVFEQFKHSKQNNNNTCINLEDEIRTSCITQESQIPDSSKQKDTCGGLYRKPPAPKGLVILGGDPKPKYQKPLIEKEKPLPLYNHYASGSGWWDNDMEGIDNDEVGFNELWEGVGSSTMGGLDWH